ncbi:hypothetical protein [Variovorax sp. RO1]|nr:hypothetical protein [Variovorax sp. RO1]
MLDIVCDGNALYFPISRQQKSGGAWVGVVQIVSVDCRRKLTQLTQ